MIVSSSGLPFFNSTLHFVSGKATGVSVSIFASSVHRPLVLETLGARPGALNVLLVLYLPSAPKQSSWTVLPTPTDS